MEPCPGTSSVTLRRLTYRRPTAAPGLPKQLDLHAVRTDPCCARDVPNGGYARQNRLSARHTARRDGCFSPEELIHDLGPSSDHWPKLFAVDHLSRPGTGVPRQP